MKLTEGNTAIVLDSTSDFPEAAARFANVRVVPLYVHFGTDSLRDHVDIDPAAFYRRLAESPELPTTSQPVPADFLAVYRQLQEEGYERIWSFHLSARLSGTYQSACRAAEEIGSDQVRVVDTTSVSVANAMLALAVQRRVARGTTDAEIDTLVGRFAREARILFTVETLDYLQKGGRIGRAQALAGSLLDVKPILAVEAGEVVPVARVRGQRKVAAELVRQFADAASSGAGLRVGLAHAAAPHWVETLSEGVRSARPDAEIELVTILGAVVGTHAGPGAVGFAWFTDGDADVS